jgi:KDO2-lipid IV(A) lauroyltransferase
LLGLSYPNPQGSYRVQHDIRVSFGVNLIPISISSLRKAFKHLRRGGVVLTLVDRPVEEGEMLDFFGRPARLPVGHARLAVRANAPMLVGYTFREGDQMYRGIKLDLIEPSHSGDEERDVRDLAQEVLRRFEPEIQKRPDEWFMFHPLWPEVIPGSST